MSHGPDTDRQQRHRRHRRARSGSCVGQRRQRHHHRQEAHRAAGEPLVPALLRLVPSTAVATSGPAGSLAEVRIRGAEAYHTLLFIDGIRANDPAAGNAPRFELSNADLVSRIEVVRGPQSALWGSEAIGGVIAVDGDPGEAPSLSAATEAGSFGFRRATASASATPGAAKLAAAVGWQRASGIDIFGGGDRDGYRNLSGRVRASWNISPTLEIGTSGFILTGRNEFDGSNPFTFAPTHDLASTNKLVAGQVWGRAGSPSSPWSGHLSASAARLEQGQFLRRRADQPDPRRAHDVRAASSSAALQPAASITS